MEILVCNQVEVITGYGNSCLPYGYFVTDLSWIPPTAKGSTDVGGARSRRYTPGRQMSHEDKRNNNSPPAVAPRTLPRPSHTEGQTSKQTAPSTGVRLKQSSWASRDGSGTVASSLCHTGTNNRLLALLLKVKK